MRECDIHHSRSIKMNSAFNLSRKPGLGCCCDFLQHLQAVIRTYRIKQNPSVVFVFTLSFVEFARVITQIVFHMKCNQI